LSRVGGVYWALWHAGLATMFRCFFFFFSPPNLQGRSVDRHQTVSHVRRRPILKKIRSEIWGSPKNIGRPKDIKVSTLGQFRDLIAIICGMQQDRQTGNGVANIHQSLLTFGELWTTNGEKHDQSFEPPNVLARKTRFNTSHWVAPFGAAIKPGIATHY